MMLRCSRPRSVWEKLDGIDRVSHEEPTAPAEPAIDLGCKEPQDLGELLKVVLKALE